MPRCGCGAGGRLGTWNGLVFNPQDGPVPEAPPVLTLWVRKLRPARLGGGGTGRKLSAPDAAGSASSRCLPLPPKGERAGSTTEVEGQVEGRPPDLHFGVGPFHTFSEISSLPLFRADSVLAGLQPADAFAALGNTGVLLQGVVLPSAFPLEPAMDGSRVTSGNQTPPVAGVSGERMGQNVKSPPHPPPPPGNGSIQLKLLRARGICVPICSQLRLTLNEDKMPGVSAMQHGAEKPGCRLPRTRPVPARHLLQAQHGCKSGECSE